MYSDVTTESVLPWANTCPFRISSVLFINGDFRAHWVSDMASRLPMYVRQKHCCGNCSWRMLSSVVLPLPFMPKISQCSPRLTSQLISRSKNWVSSSFFDIYLSREPALEIVLSGLSGTLGIRYGITAADLRC